MAGVTPEQLEQLKAMIQAAAPHSASQSDWTDTVDVIGRFIHDAGWPLVVLAALILFRDPISRISSFIYKDIRFEIDKKIESAGKSAEKDHTGLPQGLPTTSELARSVEVEMLAKTVEPLEIRSTAMRLAGEYERVRANMSPGDSRTRRMEVIVAKMRSFGGAVVPLRHELIASQSPGQRLVVIASLQVTPDYELLDWLVDRLKEEKPFVGYHAALALLVAARDPRASANLNALTSAREQLQQVESGLPTDSDRATTLAEFKSLIAHLESAKKNT
ncbi:hypothetical protein HGO38_02535 [Rhizobium sp. CG5]|uniref:hypothetical protein n=1 Tax=Rhizobium sp. CG5 TaxID=2726076 RepID=UPI00203456BE|nr:hypothetical protein [Rhizobium sp. CG5]MCM2472350.1 hypothetical protein [Rhizobium sp. CG5]